MPIRRLPEHLANKIAAGEVVERPASVVKELIENSIDAGATEITVEVEQAGRRLIAVHDNGCGIPEQELTLAIERHATSKLETEDDLFAVSTLGFRGEALPSIAAVSRFKLVSRTHDSDAGAFVEVEGGKIVKQGPIGAPVGTSVYVRDLFFNVPARLKFLKRPATEFAHILDVFTRIFLVRPQVRAKLVHNGTEVLNLDSTTDRLERAAALLGEESFRLLFPFEEERVDYRVYGLAGAPSSVRRTATSAFYFYVNGRPIRDKTLHQAVLAAYGTLIEKGSYPLVLLELTVPPHEVDVNVHPAKAEVRFRRREEVFALVRRAIARMLDQVPWLKDTPAQPSTQTEPVPNVATSQPIDHSLKQAVFSRTQQPLGAPAQSSRPQHKQYADPSLDRPEPIENPPTTSPTLQASTGKPRVEPKPKPYTTPPQKPHGLLPEGKYSSLIPIGVLHNTYIVCESESGLVLIDQHAAHERIMYVKLKHQLEQRGTKPVRTMFPLVLHVGERLASVAEGFKEEIERVGFELEPLSGGDIAVKAVPELLEGHPNLTQLVPAILAELEEHGNPDAVEEAIDLVIATAACHSAVRAGQALSPEEMQELLRQLDETERSGYCPHGRPVAVEITLAELERRFGRRK